MGDRAIPHRGTGAGERSRIGPPKVEGLSLWGIELFPIEVRVLGSLRNFSTFFQNFPEATTHLLHTGHHPHAQATTPHGRRGLSLVVFSFGGTHHQVAAAGSPGIVVSRLRPCGSDAATARAKLLAEIRLASTQPQLRIGPNCPLYCFPDSVWREE